MAGVSGGGEMRPQAEIQAMIDKLTRFNAMIEKQLGMPGADLDELAYAFNNNSTLLCSLQWVMGAETMA